MKLVLIRHSKSLINPQIPIVTWGLSDEGVNLAKQLGDNEYIQKMQVVYSSLQPKALETAILATKNHGAYIKTDDRLTEITSFTNRFVQDHVEYQKNIKNFYTGKVKKLFDGETAEEALKRFKQAIEDIVAHEIDSEFVGIVSHGNILAHFVSQFIERDVYRLAESIKQPDVAVLDWETKKFEIFFGEF